MELKGSTFILEIVNFIVLVWLLKRFLYAPVLNAIAKRKALIKKSLDEGARLRLECEALQEKYENRIRDWEKEKELARTHFNEELLGERKKRMTDLTKELEREREVFRSKEERRIAELIRNQEERAAQHAVLFSDKILSRFADADLEKKIIAQFVQELELLRTKGVESFSRETGDKNTPVEVKTAFPLPVSERQNLEKSLIQNLGSLGRYEFLQDPSLKAGIEVSSGLVVMKANLRDELQFFSEALHRER